MRVGGRYEIPGSGAGVIEVTFDAGCGETSSIIRTVAFSSA